MKIEGPKKESKSIQEWEQELIQSVDPSRRLPLQAFMEGFGYYFPETFAKGPPPKGRWAYI